MDEQAQELWDQAAGEDGTRWHRRWSAWWLLLVAGVVAIVVALVWVLGGIHGDTSSTDDRVADVQAQLDQAKADRAQLQDALEGSTRISQQLLARITQLEHALAQAGVQVPPPDDASGGAQGPAGPGGAPGPAGPPPTATATPRGHPEPSSSASPGPTPTRCIIRDLLTHRCLVSGLASQQRASASLAPRWRWIW